MKKTGFVLSIILLILLFVCPLAIVLLKTNLNTILELIKDDYYSHIIGFSFEQALLSTLFALILGLPGALILTRFNFKLKKTIELIYYIPFILPSIIVVLGFITAYGKNGLINSILGTKLNLLYKYPAVILAHVFYNFPVISSLVSNKWLSLDNNIEDEAKVCGAKDFVVLQKITLPRLLPSIISSSLLVFLFCFSSFAIILVLGGSPKLTTMEVEIYRQARISLNFDKASSLALLSLFTAYTVIYLYSIFTKPDTEESTHLNQTKRLSDLNIVPKTLVIMYLSITTLFLILPIIGIALKSFKSVSVLSISFGPIINTFIIGLLSAILTLTMSVFICSEFRDKNNKCIESLYLLPMATSSIIIGLGYFIISKYINFIPDFILIVLCHSVLNTSFAIKAILPVYKGIPKEQIEAAKLDGFNDYEIIKKIELPYVKNSMLTTFAFCFSLSCGELNSTLMIASGKITTIPLQIQRLISSYNYNGACFMGLSLIIICSIVYLICDNLKD